MQIERLFEIVYLLLQRGDTITAGELAARFEVSPRTIYRDVERLSSAGIPVYMSKGRGGGIGLLPEFVLNQALFSQEEKEEILHALQGFSATSGFGGGKKTAAGERGALAKLSLLFGRQEDWVEIDFSDWGPAGDTQEIFHLLKRAIFQRRVVRFSYFSGRGEKSSRTVEPLKLVYKGVGWYLYAWCRSRQAARFFKLSRLKAPEICEERFLPRETPPVFSGGQRLWKEETVTLRMIIAEEMAFRVYDEFPGAYARQEDGGFLVEFPFADSPFLWGYLLSFGEHLEVLEPPEIRAGLALRLGMALARYRREPPGGGAK